MKAFLYPLALAALLYITIGVAEVHARHTQPQDRLPCWFRVSLAVLCGYLWVGGIVALARLVRILE